MCAPLCRREPLAFPTAIPVGARNPNRIMHSRAISRDLAMYIYIVKVSTNYTLVPTNALLVLFSSMQQGPSPYPLAPPPAQPPPAGALARWRGEMAATDPDSGCGRTAGGSGAAQQLQRRPDSSSRPPNATVLTL